MSTIATEVAAPPDLVFGLCRDVDRWQALLPHYTRSRPIRTTRDGALIVEFIARRSFIAVLGLGLPVAWRARTWNDPDSRRLRFVHLAGATKGMDVTWRIEARGNGCLVSIDHDFRPRLPGLAEFIDRAFTRPIAGRTLATFKALAEALADPLGERLDDKPGAPMESDRPFPANKPL